MKREIRYWDSPCFLGWLKGESDKKDACKGVVEAAKRGEVLIVTSALTLVEVIKLKHQTPIPKEDAEKVKKFFERADYIEVRDVNRYIAEDARRLIWEHASLDPKDAIHVATAIRHQITILDTFDEPLIQLHGKLGNPPLRIGKPDIPYQEQEEMFSGGRQQKDRDREE